MVVFKSSKLNYFIKKNLINKLRKDSQSKNHKLITEGDLQAAAYCHIRKKLEKDKTWIISNQFPIKEKGEKKKIPDIVISRQTSKKPFRPNFFIEFKELKIYARKKIMKDVKKLEKIQKGEPKVFRFIIFISREGKKAIKKKRTEEKKFFEKYYPNITLLLFSPRENIDADIYDKWKKDYEEIKGYLPK